MASLRTRVMLLSLLLLLLAALPAAALDDTVLYDVGDTLSFSVPEDYALIDRDTKPGDPNIAAMGFDYDGLVDYLESGDFYLICFPESEEYTFMLRMRPDAIADAQSFSTFSDDMLWQKAEDYRKILEDEWKVTLSSSFICHHEQTFLIKQRYATYDLGQDVDVTTYFTIQNGMRIEFICLANSAMAQTAEKALDALVFSTRFKDPDPGYVLDAYADFLCESGDFTFLLPYGWAPTAPLSEKGELLRLQKGEAVITLSERDIFHRGGFDMREQMSGALMDDAQALALLHAEEGGFSRFLLDGVEFFSYTIKQLDKDSETYIDTHCYAHISSGYLLELSYTAMAENPVLLSQFQSIPASFKLQPKEDAEGGKSEISVEEPVMRLPTLPLALGATLLICLSIILRAFVFAKPLPLKSSIPVCACLALLGAMASYFIFDRPTYALLSVALACVLFTILTWSAAGAGEPPEEASAPSGPLLPYPPKGKKAAQKKPPDGAEVQAFLKVDYIFEEDAENPFDDKGKDA